MMTTILKDLSVPTLLIEGTAEQTQEYATQAICQYFCKQNAADCFCIDCRRVRQRQHPYLLWICPEKDYTVDEVDAVFDKVRFALEDQERFFFVLEKTQALNAATANRLLKVLEEPPLGYVFILLTTNKNAMLPTILSRSHIISLGGAQQAHALHPLADYLLKADRLDDPFGFEQELKKYKLSEREAVQLCFDMLEYLTRKRAQSHGEDVYSTKVFAVIKESLCNPPGSGSADFFLKALFLKLLGGRQG